jgi:hypothetical protein
MNCPFLLSLLSSPHFSLLYEMSPTFSGRLWSASFILAITLAGVQATPALEVSISGQFAAEPLHV